MEGDFASLILFSTNVTCDHSLAIFFARETTIISVFILNVRSYTGIVDDFSQALEQFFSIVVEIAVDSINLLVLNHIETAFSISNQSFVVRDDNYTALILVNGVC
ncbi:hypothetical protein ALC62_02338 [Cyphomyrmex costatus]|uniref:Uncharacterized protein n=1 Tax=Cyphomyrmex costatus TaxID=456900 RepID=A0A195D191_9HYME|nr:hypothetical protein ALC62_02338 [Cyphomyrmex costatus]